MMKIILGIRRIKHLYQELYGNGNGNINAKELHDYLWKDMEREKHKSLQKDNYSLK